MSNEFAVNNLAMFFISSVQKLSFWLFKQQIWQ